MSVDPTWYLLYGGSSAEGRGPGRYEGRTTDRDIAKKYYNNIKDNPYSTGYVLIITDTEIERMNRRVFNV